LHATRAAVSPVTLEPSHIMGVRPMSCVTSLWEAQKGRG
jgi:hypothetical protein